MPCWSAGLSRAVAGSTSSAPAPWASAGPRPRLTALTDPGADSWVALVDYGDGNGPQPLKINPSGKFQLQHKYLAPGTYRVTVTILDDDGGIGTDSFLVTIPS